MLIESNNSHIQQYKSTELQKKKNLKTPKESDEITKDAILPYFIGLAINNI